MHKKALILILVISFALFVQIPVASCAWLGGWDQRVKITIDAGDFDAELTHFPLPLYLSASCGENAEDVTFIFDEVGANSKKIAVTRGDGETELFVEIEEWDFGNEEAWLWVSNSTWSISAGGNTDIYLYYDNDHVDNDAYVGVKGSLPAEQVWDSYFEGVFHLEESSPPTAFDSTNNDFDLTAGSRPAGNPDAVVSRGQDFEWADKDVLENSGFDSGTSNVTLEGWTTWESFYSYMGHFGQYNYAVGNYVNDLDITVSSSATTLYMRAYDNDGDMLNVDTLHSGNRVVDTFYYLTIQLDVTNKYLYAWQDDALLGSDYEVNFDADPHLDQENFCVGDAWSISSMDGIIDEVRISFTFRSDAYISANFEAQSDNVCDWGAEETPAIPFITLYNTTGGEFWLDDDQDGSAEIVVNGTQTEYDNDTVLLLIAVPYNASWFFTNFSWSGDMATVNPYNFTVAGNNTIWCNFVDPPWGKIGAVPTSILFVGAMVVFGLFLFVFVISRKKR